MSRLVKAEDLVYCVTHTEIHTDTLDPYNEGWPTCYDMQYGVLKSHVHRTVYWRTHKGDYEEGS